MGSGKGLRRGDMSGGVTVNRKIPNSLNGDASLDGAEWGATGEEEARKGGDRGTCTTPSPWSQRHLNTALPRHSAASAWSSGFLSS